MNNVLSTIFILHFFNDGVKITLTSLLPFIAKNIPLTFTQIGFLGAASGLMTILLAVPMGIVATRVNGMKIIFLSLLAYSLCAIGISISPNYAALLLFFYIAGVSFAPFHIVSQSAVVRAAKKETIGRAISSLSMVGDTGRVMLPPLALLIVNFLAWRNTYIIIGTAGIILFLSLLFFLRKQKEMFLYKNTAIADESSKDWVKHFLRSLQKKELRLVILGGVFDGIGGSAVYLYLPFLFLSKGIPQSFLFIFVGAYFIGSLAGRKLFGKGIDLHGPAKIFVFAEVIMAVLLVILTLMHNVFLIFIITIILGFFARGTVPVVTTLFAAVSHEAHYEKIFAHGEIFLGAASVISPIVLGKMADSFGIDATFYLASGFALIATIPIYFLINKKN